jgi:hypothetical protein
VECGSGGRTKWNLIRLGVTKTHATDAACVGCVESLASWSRPILAIKAMGRGAYQRARLDQSGFPRGYLMRQKRVAGFQTGDMVRAVVLTGKHAGAHIGRVAVRASKSFNIQTKSGTMQGISAMRCVMLSRADGYGCAIAKAPASSPRPKSGVSGGGLR